LLLKEGPSARGATLCFSTRGLLHAGLLFASLRSKLVTVELQVYPDTLCHYIKYTLTTQLKIVNQVKLREFDVIDGCVRPCCMQKKRDRNENRSLVQLNIEVCQI
jgi:hypothetical protein